MWNWSIKFSWVVWPLFLMVDLAVYGLIVNSFLMWWIWKSYQEPPSDVKGIPHSNRNSPITPHLILNFYSLHIRSQRICISNKNLSIVNLTVFLKLILFLNSLENFNILVSVFELKLNLADILHINTLPSHLSKERSLQNHIVMYNCNKFLTIEICVFTMKQLSTKRLWLLTVKLKL